MGIGARLPNGITVCFHVKISWTAVHAEIRQIKTAYAFTLEQSTRWCSRGACSFGPKSATVNTVLQGLCLVAVNLFTRFTMSICVQNTIFDCASNDMTPSRKFVSCAFGRNPSEGMLYNTEHHCWAFKASSGAAAISKGEINKKSWAPFFVVVHYT